MHKGIPKSKGSFSSSCLDKTKKQCKGDSLARERATSTQPTRKLSYSLLPTLTLALAIIDMFWSLVVSLFLEFHGSEVIQNELLGIYFSPHAV